MAGPAGPPGSSGSQVVIPKVLEVEELIVRRQDGGGYLRIVGGTSGRVARISWHSSSRGVTGEIYAGSTEGMVLQEWDGGGPSNWTRVCIGDGSIGLCPV